MSLINDMLKNLEKREIRPPAITHISLATVPKRMKPILFHKTLFLYCLLIFFIFIMITFLLFHQNHSSSIATMLPAEQPEKERILPDTEEMAWIKPVSITGITLQVKDNITEISLMLSHPVLYRLVSNEMENQLSLIIDHAELQSALPLFNYINTALQRMTTQTSKDDVQLNLSLAPGAVIKYVNLNNQDKDPELVIAIASPSNTMMPSASQTALIKTPAMQNFISQQYQEALTTAEKGDIQLAISQLSSLLKMDPDYKNARVSLAALLIRQGFYANATLLIKEGLRLNPGYTPFIELKARLLTMRGKSIQALALLQNYSPSINDNPDYHAFIAALYERNNKDRLATKIYQQLLSIDPHNGSWWFGLGVSSEKLGLSKKAIEAYSRALAEGHLNSDSVVYLQNHLQKLQEADDEKG